MRDTCSKWIAATTVIALVLVAVIAGSPSAQAQDFFTALFGGLTGERSARSSLPFASEFGDPGAAPSRPAVRMSSGSAAAYCVRTCDGRYFPISSSKGQSRAATCSSFCPASETKVFYGSGIDRATSQSGKSYSELPNAFRYRNELVAGCTCNGKSAEGLARISIQDDPTLRKGDLVAARDGSLVASRASDARGASANSGPVSRSAGMRVTHIPVVAAE